MTLIKCMLQSCIWAFEASLLFSEGICLIDEGGKKTLLYLFHLVMMQIYFSHICK